MFQWLTYSIEFSTYSCRLIFFSFLHSTSAAALRLGLVGAEDEAGSYLVPLLKYVHPGAKIESDSVIIYKDAI
jgi:hypothetical protein